MDSIYLHGSEQVQSAASRMASAADDMQRAANIISEAATRIEYALREHAERIEAAMAGVK
jgi:hypothetical protein